MTLTKVIHIQNREKTIFWSLLSLLLLCLGFYIYMINSTVRNVVTAESMESKISQLNLSISSKEFQYISVRNAITLNTAYSLGFKEVVAKNYIKEEDKSKSVSFLSN